MGYPRWNNPKEVAKFFFEHEKDKPLSFASGHPLLTNKWKAVPIGRLYRVRLLESLIKKVIEDMKILKNNKRDKNG